MKNNILLLATLLMFFLIMGCDTGTNSAGSQISLYDGLIGKSVHFSSLADLSSNSMRALGETRVGYGIFNSINEQIPANLARVIVEGIKSNYARSEYLKKARSLPLMTFTGTDTQTNDFELEFTLIEVSATETDVTLIGLYNTRMYGQNHIPTDRPQYEGSDDFFTITFKGGFDGDGFDSMILLAPGSGQSYVIEYDFQSDAGLMMIGYTAFGDYKYTELLIDGASNLALIQRFHRFSSSEHYRTIAWNTSEGGGELNITEGTGSDISQISYFDTDGNYGNTLIVPGTDDKLNEYNAVSQDPKTRFESYVMPVASSFSKYDSLMAEHTESWQ